MANSHFKHSKITGVCTVVTSKRIKLDDETGFYPDATKLERLKNVVGLCERAVVDPGTTPADLMESAANELINKMDINTNELDALICVLDNPDYKCPPTACVLHGKLGLPQNCMAFDITHGCAGYVYGLNVAFSMIESNYKKIMLLVGDTKSTTINIKDRISAPIFGDGASATMIEYSEQITNSWFSLGTVGKMYESIMIPAGGARLPYSIDTAKEKTDEFGNTRSDNNFRMNGRAVFDFTMNNVPQNLQQLFDYSGVLPKDIDYFVFHQANKSIIDNIALRFGITDKNKVPTQTLAKYGNLSVASIPSVINDQLFDVASKNSLKLCLSGFGVGLSYGCVVLTLDKICTPPVLNYNGE